MKAAMIDAAISSPKSRVNVPIWAMHTVVCTKPIKLGESGLRALGFIRQNAWIFSAIPASLNIVTFLFGLKNMVLGTPAKPTASERRAVEREVERKAPKSLLGHAAHWGGHGWRVYKIYRRFKKYIPH